MFSSIHAFAHTWKDTSAATRKVFSALTDEALSQAVTPEDRTLGRIAWHLVTSIPELTHRTGLAVEGVAEDAPMPASAAEIRGGYASVSDSLLRQVTTKWKDDTLEMEDPMYGETWKRGESLMVLIHHEIHHRGQITVLMRQAGLKVSGCRGPRARRMGTVGNAVAGSLESRVAGCGKREARPSVRKVLPCYH